MTTTLAPSPTLMSQQRPPGFRRDIQGLRAIAVFIVIAFHFGLPFCQGGFVGVDIFFVLSGYLITGLLVNELQQTGEINYARFYARRARRLLPASALVIVCTCLASVFIFPPIEQEQIYRAALSTAAYVSNIYFAHAAQDYFAAQSSPNPLLHTWSLAVEEHFYLVWPLLLALTFRRAQNLKTLRLAVSVISLLSLAACIYYTGRNQPWAFFLAPMRAWEFGLGAMLSLGIADRFFTRGQRRWLGWAGLATLLISASLLTDKLAFPGVIALLPVVGTAAVLGAGRTSDTQGVARLLSIAPLQFVGDISYSLYLWHWPMIVLIGALSLHPDRKLRLLAFLLTLVAAYLSYVYVEVPFRSSPFFSKLHRRTVLASTGLTAVLCLGCVGWGQWIVHQKQYAIFNSVTSELPELFNKGCDVPLTEYVPKVCTFGAPQSSTLVVLFGDSHAAQWFPALSSIASSEGWTLVTLIKSSCPSAKLEVFRRTANWGTECDQWRSEALARIQKLRPTAILLGNYSGYNAANNPKAAISYQRWLEAYQSTLAQLSSSHAHILLLQDTPTLPYDSTGCLARVAWTGTGACPPVTRAASIDLGAARAAEDASRDFNDHTIVDLNDLICGEIYCSLSIAGRPVYRDMNHLTVSFVRNLTPELAARIVPIIAAPRVKLQSNGGH